MLPAQFIFMWCAKGTLISLRSTSCRWRSGVCTAGIHWQPDSEEQSYQPDSKEQSYQPYASKQSHPNPLLGNIFINDWYKAAQNLWEKAEATLRNSFGEEVCVMNPDLVLNLVVSLMLAPYWDESRLSSTSKISSKMSTHCERGTGLTSGQMLIQQRLVQQASAAAFWHRLISTFSALVDPGALTSLWTRRVSDSLSSKRRKMYLIPHKSEQMVDMESDKEEFCGLECGYRFKSLWGCLILVVDILSFDVPLKDIADSSVTSTIGMRVWGCKNVGYRHCNVW